MRKMAFMVAFLVLTGSTLSAVTTRKKTYRKPVVKTTYRKYTRRKPIPKTVKKVKKTTKQQEKSPIKPAPKLSGVSVYRATFEKDLFLKHDLNMKGLHATERLTFTKPRRWNILEGTELHLFFNHSEALLPSLSHLSIAINNITLKSITLTKENSVTTEVIMPIPPYILDDYNTLSFLVDQHYTEDCEDPFSPALWTKISKKSYILFKYRPLSPIVNLGLFPYPFFDKRDYGTREINFVVPKIPTISTVEAMSYIDFILSNYISFRNVKINLLKSASETDKDVILVGTIKENPEILKYASMDELFPTKGGANISPGTGVLLIKNDPKNTKRAVLIVTGMDPPGVEKAAKALFLASKILSGQRGIIYDANPVDTLREREQVGYIPLKKTFKLSELGMSDTTVRGFYAKPVNINLFTQPDAQFFPKGSKLNLVYSYSAGLDGRLSMIEVIINNRSIVSKLLRNKAGESYATLSVPLPTWLLGPRNHMLVVFHLFPINYDPCRRVSDKQIWGTVHAKTEIKLDREYFVEMPDVSLIKYGGFPYTLWANMKDVVFVIPDKYTLQDIHNLLLLVSYFGKNTFPQSIRFRVVTPDLLNGTEFLKNYHIIAIGNESDNSFVRELSDRKYLYVTKAGVKTLRTYIKTRKRSLWHRIFGGGEEGVRTEVLKAYDFDSAGYLEQIISPYNKNKTVLVAYARNEKNIQYPLEALLVPKILTKFKKGNIIAVNSAFEVKSIDVGKKRIIGNVGFLKRLKFYIARHVLLLSLILIIVLYLLYKVIKTIVDAYKKKRLMEEEE